MWSFPGALKPTAFHSIQDLQATGQPATFYQLSAPFLLSILPTLELVGITHTRSPAGPQHLCPFFLSVRSPNKASAPLGLPIHPLSHGAYWLPTSTHSPVLHSPHCAQRPTDFLRPLLLAVAEKTLSYLLSPNFLDPLHPFHHIASSWSCTASHTPRDMIFLVLPEAAPWEHKSLCLLVSHRCHIHKGALLRPPQNDSPQPPLKTLSSRNHKKQKTLGPSTSLTFFFFS